MAKEHPLYENVEWPTWEFQEFPMMVYPGAKNPRKPDYDKRGRPSRGVIVNTMEEADEAMGIVRDPENPEEDARVRARTEKPVLVDAPGGTARMQTAADLLDALRQQASELGMQFDKRWSHARLQTEIDNFQAESEVV